MDAFWCITFSILVLRWWWKHNKPVKVEKRTPLNTSVTQEQLRERNRLLAERSKDEEDLRKQGYDDELIATILPVINDK